MQKINSTLAVVIWMAGAITSFTLMGVAGRELSAELDTFGILLLRSLVCLIVILVIMQSNGWKQVKTQRIGTHLFRNLVHFGGQYGWFFGISLLPLAQVFALEFTVPLWGLLLAVLYLNEQMTKPRVIALLLGLIGVLVILRPGIIPLNSAVIAVLIGAGCYAIAHICTKSLITTDTPLCILFYMTIIQLPICAVTAWPTFAIPTMALWPWVMAVGLSALCAHYCLAQALANGDASIVLPIDFLRLPFIALIAALLYGEPIDLWLFGGAALMVIGNLYGLHAEKARIPTPG